VGKEEFSSALKHVVPSSLALLGIATLMSLVSVNDADAQTRTQICRSLNAQLASLSRGGSSGGNSAQYRKFDNAARSQQIQITKTKRIAKRGRCTGLGIFNSKSAQCRRIISSLKKMEANLRNLKNSRAKHAPRQAGSSRKRNNILRQMKRNRCQANGNSQQAKVKVTKTKRKTLLEQVFGVKTYKENGQRDNNNSNGNFAPTFSGLNTYRTLCVRQTDGYYFPISFSTVKDRFDKDQATCQSMCPGTTVELYHHKMPSEDSEDMVNYRTGKEYAKEPFAFAYRKSVDLDQKCRFATENRVQSIETASTEIAGKPKSTKIGTPVWREDPALAPDDHDASKDGVNLKVATAYLLDARIKDENPDNQLLVENRNVRIVGPAFFPVQ
jgi:hypothetical protein